MILTFSNTRDWDRALLYLPVKPWAWESCEREHTVGRRDDPYAQAVRLDSGADAWERLNCSVAVAARKSPRVLVVGAGEPVTDVPGTRFTIDGRDG